VAWNAETIAEALSRTPGFAEAALIALVLAIAAIVLSWVAGLAIVLAGRSKIRALRALAGFYVWFIRGTPTLIQVFMVYFGFPQLGMRLDPYIAGVVALGLSGAAYVAEILRAGFNAVPAGQFEAARSLGLRPVATDAAGRDPATPAHRGAGADQRGDEHAQEHVAPVDHHHRRDHALRQAADRQHLPAVRLLHPRRPLLPRDGGGAEPVLALV
jgi:His/Glu/Gln/Arg/opine family amino acid ABC transporter permease subunit